MAKINVFLAAVALALGVASAVTPEEKKAQREAAFPIISACLEEFGYSRDDIFAAQKAKDIDALNSCFYACFFKKTGIINEDGLFDADVALEKNKKYIKDEDDINAIAAIHKTCSSVNEASVTDGAKGCERSKMLFACFIKEDPGFFPFSADTQ